MKIAIQKRRIEVDLLDLIMSKTILDLTGKIDDSYLQGPGGFQFF